MKFQKRIASLLVGTQLLMALSACSTSSTNETTKDDSKNPQSGTVQTVEVGAMVESYDLEGIQDVIYAVSGYDSSTVVATAGDYTVTLGDLLPFTLNDLDQMAAMAAYGFGDIPWGESYGDELFEEVILSTALELAMLYQLIPDKAAELGFQEDPAFLEEMEAYLGTVLTEVAKDNETILDYILWQSLATRESFLENSVITNYYNEIYNHYFAEGGEMYPDEEALLASMEAANKYSSKHILIKTVDSANQDLDEAAQAEALEKAESILAELKACSPDELPELFHELMVEHSEDGGSVASPDGYTVGPGEFVPEYEAAALELEPGEMTELVKTSYGYHIILRLDLMISPEDIHAAVHEESMHLQTSWLDELDIQRTEVLDGFNLEAFFENWVTLCNQVDPYIIAGSLTLPEEETPESSETEADSADTDSDDAVSNEEETEEESEESEESEEESEESEEESEESDD